MPSGRYDLTKLDDCVRLVQSTAPRKDLAEATQQRLQLNPATRMVLSFAPIPDEQVVTLLARVELFAGVQPQDFYQRVVCDRSGKSGVKGLAGIFGCARAGKANAAVTVCGHVNSLLLIFIGWSAEPLLARLKQLYPLFLETQNCSCIQLQILSRSRK